MGPSDRNGWASILGEDLSTSEDGPAASAGSQPTEPADPVLAALAELDGTVPDLDEEEPTGAGERTVVDTAARASDGAGPARPSVDLGPVPAPAPPLHALRPAKTGSLDLPIPDGPPRAPAIEPEVSPLAGFSTERLIEGLEPGTTGATEPAEPAPAATVWSEYKEVILICAVGLVLMIGAFAWSRSGPSPEPPRPVQVTKPTEPAPPTESEAEAQAEAEAPAASEPPTPAAEPSGRSDSDEPAPAAPKPSATPMLSVVTVPGGALVEIDGVIYGRSPLIMPSPKDRKSLRVKLKLDDHQPWEQVVRPNEAGHFNVNVKLEPFRTRR